MTDLFLPRILDPGVLRKEYIIIRILWKIICAESKVVLGTKSHFPSWLKSYPKTLRNWPTLYWKIPSRNTKRVRIHRLDKTKPKQPPLKQNTQKPPLKPFDLLDLLEEKHSYFFKGKDIFLPLSLMDNLFFLQDTVTAVTNAYHTSDRPRKPLPLLKRATRVLLTFSEVIMLLTDFRNHSTSYFCYLSQHICVWKPFMS